MFALEEGYIRTFLLCGIRTFLLWRYKVHHCLANFSALSYHARMIGFCCFASGSRGNCLYLGTKTTKVLIDAGLSARATVQRLAEIGVSLEQIDAVIITHEHIDHIRGLGVLCGKHKIPVFANSDTAKAIYTHFQEEMIFRIFTNEESFAYGDIEVLPFSIQHDAIDPVGFVIQAEGVKIGICADLGFASTWVVSRLQGCDYLYLEANHHPSMVHASPRPALYKQRVLSRQGHLSNEECAHLVGCVCHPGLKHIYLAHLSSECNSMDLALQIVQKKLEEIQSTAEVSIAFQDRTSAKLYF